MKLTVLLLTVLIISITVSGGNVLAQEATIETSADAFDGRFFGEGVLRVIVTDPDAENDDAIEEIQIDIRAEPGSGPSVTESLIVPETSDSSGRFELFLVHVDATAISPDDLDPTNNAGVEGDGTCVADCTPFATFGPGGDIDMQSELYEEVDFEITTSNIETELSYESTTADLELDRDAYGTTSFVYILVVDQDANLNPTARDEFMIDPDSSPNSDLLALGGGTFEDVIVFEETGRNTAVFEGRYRLGESIVANTESLSLTLFDKANYEADLAAQENDSNNIDEVSFIVGNTGGTVDIRGEQQPAPTRDPMIDADKDSYALGESVHVTVIDQDANANIGAADSLLLRVSGGGSEIELTALETGANTGVFEASFMLSEEEGEGTIAPGGAATITYTDERPADYSEMVQAGQSPEKDFVLEIDVQLPVMTGAEAIDVTAPTPVDITGGGGQLAVGEQVTLSTVVSNNNNASQAFVALIAVKDSSGMTVFLALQSGTLESRGSTEIGALWQPVKADTFEVLAFVFSSLVGGEVLSPVAESKITIN